MLKDPMLEWTKRLIISWVNINCESYKEFIYTLDLNYVEKFILIHYFIPNNNKTKTFKEIEYELQKSHDTVMNYYTKALQKLLNSLGPRIYKDF